MRFITADQEHQLRTIMFAKKIHVQDLPASIGGCRASWTAMLSGKREMNLSQIIKLSRLLSLNKQQTLDLLLNFELFPEIEAKQ